MPELTGMPSTQEDTFFILRDSRELFQRRLVEIARQSGVTSPVVLDAFSREIGQAHDELTASSQRDGFEQTAGLTASRITLVGDDDLELDIRIGEIANRLNSNERIDRWRVQLRYMTLLNRPKMTAANSPVGLDPICRGLWTICRESGATLDQNLDRLERLEAQLQEHLPVLYIELNDQLAQRNIEPASAQVTQRGSKPSAKSESREAGSTGNTPAGTNALSSLQQALQRQSTADDVLAEPLFGNPAGGSGNIVLNASTLVMLNHLMDRLSALENPQTLDLFNTHEAGSGETSPLRALKAKDLDLPLGKPAAIALDTLSHIFECIFESTDLADVVKAAIGRLQIPLLKIAILDASFFSDTQHPARHLINRMARAAIGLAQDASRDHPVCVRLGKLADAVRATLDTNQADLLPHLAELEALITERDQLQQTSAQAYLQLVTEHEGRMVSRANAQAWLRKTLEKTSQPEIVTFLTHDWVRVMQVAAEKEGTTSGLWQECDATITDFLWSIEPKNTQEERKKLLALIPSLLKRINNGLDFLAIPSETRTPFLDTCFNLQTAALRSRTETLAQTTPAKVPPAPAEENVSVQLLESGGKLVQYFGLPTGTASPWRNGGYPWREGDWISFKLPDGERLCGRHCGKSAPGDTLLLFNTEWGYAVAWAPSALETQFRSNEARITSEASLFDEAATRALGQISPPAA